MEVGSHYLNIFPFAFYDHQSCYALSILFIFAVCSKLIAFLTNSPVKSFIKIVRYNLLVFILAVIRCEYPFN